MNSLSENNNIFTSYTSKSLSPQSHRDNVNMEVCNLPVSGTKVNEIWTKTSFNNRQTNPKRELSLKLDDAKMSWSCQNESKEDAVEVFEEKMDLKSPTTSEPEVSSPSPPHHARRPMNAFLIFCKKHRPIVRRKYPNLENRGVTRILGEWWAVLDANDKNAYTNLAKEYKDAFFSANPNFKWYKLPAPPLRTLPIRPTNIKQETSPPISPTNILTLTPEFTPGKLADETQLGMLSSLLTTNSNFNNKTNETDTKRKCTDYTFCNNNNQIDNNNKDDFKNFFQSPINYNQNTTLPPKPIKKRLSESYTDNKNVMRNIFIETPKQNDDVNMTQQQIVNKVVECQFSKEEDYKLDFKDTRKSVRKCKGNRYAEFMANGKLIKNKRDKQMSDTPKLDLNNTIKRLEERIQPKLNEEAKERTRTISEMSDTDDYSKTIPSFNLDQRILELPSLSYETYLQRKKENKKRKFVRKTESKPKVDSNPKLLAVQKKPLIGSKKRKNKQNITHLEKDKVVGNNFGDLSGLATLAEIAAIKAKIDST